MSEKSKGDTSRIIKNPLLSASVTGLTFEDFPNKPLLLPAAPPVAPPLISEDYGTSSEEHQKSVTVGQTPEIDTETLSEINLNVTTDDEGNQIDVNDPPQNAQYNIQDESILFQAASSFSQLPTVASTVFSTFSKVIKEYTPSSNTREGSAEKDFQEPTEKLTERLSPYIRPEFSDRSDNYQAEPRELEPPRLYSPSEVTFSAPSISHPPVTKNQNSYRLSAKKKTYAQIPGLSVPASQADQQKEFFKPSNPNENRTYQTPSDDVLSINSSNASTGNISYITAEPKSEEKKGFSLLSSFVPPVWQNITGLVQSSITNDIGNSEQRRETFQSDVNAGSNEFNPTFTQTNQPIYTTPAFNVPPPSVIQESVKNTEVTSIPLIPSNTSEAVPVSIFTPLSKESQPPVSQQNIGIASYTASNNNSFALPLFSPHDSNEKIGLNQEDNAVNQNNLSLKTFHEDNQVSNLPVGSVKDFKGITSVRATAVIEPVRSQPQKPPKGPIGGNTFRLQKGTRLYKNPFNPANESTTTISPFVPCTSNSGVSLPFGGSVGSGNSASFVTQQTTFSPPLEAIKTTESSFLGSERNNSCNLNRPEHLGGYQSNISPYLEKINTPNSPGSVVENVPLFSVPNDSALNVKDTGNTENIFQRSPINTADHSDNQVNSLVPLASKSGSLNKQDSSIKILAIFNPQSDPKNVNSQLLQDTVVEKKESYSSDFELGSVSSIKEDFNYPINQSTANNTPFEKRVAPLVSEQTTNTSRACSLSNYFSQNSDPNVQSTGSILTPSTVLPLNQASLPPAVDSVAQNKIENFFVKNKKLTTESNRPVAAFDSDPLAFFDSFRPPLAEQEIKSSENISEDSNSVKIQDFFNNPPQSINDSGSDLNYKLVGSGVTDKRLENLSAPASDSRALSPISNIVEPPSSSCSEFSSEFTAKIVGNLSSLSKEDLPDELLEKFEMAGLLGGTNAAQPEPYKPVSRHWFYKKNIDSKQIWTPFSLIDSSNLEIKIMSPDGNEIVPVEGGRFDVNITKRVRTPVYWAEEPSEVRRCSWFYKAVDSKYVPYEEAIADLLEEEYREASESGEWHRKIALPTGETVVFHGSSIIVHFLQAQNSTDTWSSTTQTPARPRVVKRGIEDFNIEPGESERVDHLLFMVHGVGSACDLKFRPLEEVVEEFRSIANQLIQAHYKNSYDTNAVGRVEVLPVSWHSQLHSEESGIDEKLKAITLESIPKLRNFTNDTLLDILFYTSPRFCQNIMSTVAEALNHTYIKYCQRNPNFKGGVSLAGHSLGSLILFDLLCHQKPSEEMEVQNSENPDRVIKPLQLNHSITGDLQQPTSQQVSYTIGPAGTGQPYINYPQLIFHPMKFFALGSPIGMFVTIRGIDTLGLEFKLPTCTNFFHIFHPYDPVAYRIEALINPNLSSARPVLIPHHKGRKRMHLELKETMTRVGADLKQKIVDTFRNTFESVHFLSPKNKMETKEEIEKEVDKVLEMQLEFDKNEQRSRANSSSTHSDVDTGEVDVPLGKLNDNRRIDYVLQEAPLEFFNEYLFAFASHVCYWDSEDTILFIMKEIYSSLGIRSDNQVPQQSMTIERPNSRVNSLSCSTSSHS